MDVVLLVVAKKLPGFTEKSTMVRNDRQRVPQRDQNWAGTRQAHGADTFKWGDEGQDRLASCNSKKKEENKKMN